MKKTIYFLGNQLIDSDNKAWKIVSVLKDKLPNFSFLHFDPTEELPSKILNRKVILIDTVVGIEKVTCISSLNHWSISPRNTVHDFDLPLNLGILQKLGKLRKLTIVGIPTNGDIKQIVEEVINILKSV